MTNSPAQFEIASEVCIKLKYSSNSGLRRPDMSACEVEQELVGDEALQASAMINLDEAESTLHRTRRKEEEQTVRIAKGGLQW